MVWHDMIRYGTIQYEKTKHDCFVLVTLITVMVVVAAVVARVVSVFFALFETKL